MLKDLTPQVMVDRAAVSQGINLKQSDDEMRDLVSKWEEKILKATLLLILMFSVFPANAAVTVPVNGSVQGFETYSFNSDGNPIFGPQSIDANLLTAKASTATIYAIPKGGQQLWTQTTTWDDQPLLFLTSGVEVINNVFDIISEAKTFFVGQLLPDARN